MRLSFVWWNTSLSPAGKDRATDEQRVYVRQLIDYFVEGVGADFIALGEVKEDDIKIISESCAVEGYGLHRGNDKAGRSSFDTCVLYKKSSLSLENILNITSRKGGRTYKVAQRLDFSLLDYEFPLHVLVSHWPSRLHLKAGEPDRAYLGMRLRIAVDELIDKYKEDAAFILLGDYNDEPFDESLSEHLMATRDKCLVRKKMHLLYNPFWKYLGSNSRYSHREYGVAKDGGSYYHKSGGLTRWRTFDQIIFSPRFLGRTKLHLNEEFTQMLSFPGYADLVMDVNKYFDHFPIVGVVEKVA